MGKNRLEAFSDGVLAIIITIMVLELRPPSQPTLEAAMPLGGTLVSYILSFIYIGIYWSNHHHLLHTVHKVTGAILWANLHLLFWLSLVPAATAWLGESGFASLPVLIYGLNLLMAAVAFTILVFTILKSHGSDSLLARAIGRDYKSKVSLLLYSLGVALAQQQRWAALALYGLVAAIWLVPDRRIEDQT